jgi:hypothetical protein
MRRFHQLLFSASIIAMSWFVMMGLHELGHVIGAMVTGGTVEHVVLHPLTISRTDVSPNPHPAVVVWLGPVIGCLLPTASIALVPRRLTVLGKMACFIAGFCLAANGAYIAFGSFDRVGDCGEMARTGTPVWIMLAFGIATISYGLFLWHGLGSSRRFFGDPTLVTPRMTYSLMATLVAIVIAESILSSR